MKLTFCSCFTNVFYCYKRVVVQHFTWCLLWVLKAECTLKFHKPQVADYQYRTTLVTEHPPSNFEHPVQLTKQIRRLQWQTAHLSVAHTRHYMHDCHLPSREQEDRAVFLLIPPYSSLYEIDYKSFMAEDTVCFTVYRCQISSTPLGSLC